MSIYLNEDQLGADNVRIGFPHLLLCMGVLLLTRGNMYGVHIVSRSNANQTIPQFGVFLGRMGVIPGDMVSLYGSCNFAVRYNGAAAPVTAWQNELRHIAGVIGFRGTGRGFDTSIIAPRDGTYVEYLPNQAHDKCKIFYKRNEKVNFTATPLAAPTMANVFKASDRNGGQHGPSSSAFGTDDANVIATQSNGGNLHEVNYFMRLKSFTI